MTLNTQKIKIQEINNEIELMASLVAKQLNKCMIVLKTHDDNLGNEVIGGDDKVDDLQKKIDKECVKFIATEQPVASDLRQVFTATKIVTDLERIADYAVDICKLSKSITKDIIGDYEESTLAIWTMEEKVQTMIKEAIKAYGEADYLRAYDICKMDDEVDILYKSIFEGLLKVVKVDESRVNSYTRLLFVAKYLERVGDHVTNICEWIIFAKEGKYVDLNE